MNKRMTTLRAGTLTAVLTILCLVLPPAERATAQSIVNDAFTQVRVQGDVPVSIVDETEYIINGATSFTHSGTNDPSFSNDAFVHGEGFASFGTLKAKIELSGPAGRWARTTTYFNEIYTPTGGTPGTADEMTFVYSLDGQSTVEVSRTDIEPGSGLQASVGFGVFLVVHGGESEFIFSHSIDLSNYTTVPGLQIYTIPSPPELLTVTVPFEYGETFSLRTRLNTNAASDHDRTGVTFSPYFETWGGGVTERIVVDFSNTAELIAIVNETNPNMILVGQSGTDYTPLVTDTMPVIPEPATLTMFAIVGMALLVRIRVAPTKRLRDPGRDMRFS